MEDNVTDYVSRLYEVYDMQDYLKNYAGTLMNYTIEDGDGLVPEKGSDTDQCFRWWLWYLQESCSFLE